VVAQRPWKAKAAVPAATPAAAGERMAVLLDEKHEASQRACCFWHVGTDMTVNVGGQGGVAVGPLWVWRIFTPHKEVHVS